MLSCENYIEGNFIDKDGYSITQEQQDTPLLIAMFIPCFYLQACLSCGNVACGRYISEHALQHYNDTKHPLCMEVNDKYVYWYVSVSVKLNLQ